MVVLNFHENEFNNFMRYILIITASLMSVLASGCAEDYRHDGEVRYINFNLSKVVRDEVVLKPADIIKYKNKYVYAELLENTIGSFASPFDPNLMVGKFNPKSVDKKFRSPHFLATDGDRIYISNGWGKSVASISSLQGADFEEVGVVAGKQLWAPHGLCVGDDGFLYIGDSLNSRVVRIEIQNPKNQSVFSDINNKISYSRQLVCKDGEVWISNSYEDRPSLNKGLGSNVLRIKNWDSGLADVVFEHPSSNISGIAVIDKTLVIGLWSNEQAVIAKNLYTSKTYYVARKNDGLGIPYGMLYEPESRRLIVSYLGTLDKNSTGGFVVFDINESDALNAGHDVYEIPPGCGWMNFCELNYVAERINLTWKELKDDFGW